jgi:hypothetical protein
MNKPKKRKIALYCMIICNELIIAKMPEEFVPWSQVRKELNAILKLEWGILAKDIHAVEALAGTVNDSDGDGGEALEKCEKAFSGDNTHYRRFSLISWDKPVLRFKVIRKVAES